VRTALLYSRLETLELARIPSFLLPTLGFPALFFVFFVVPGVTDSDAELLTASYLGFAFLGVAFFQFGVATAAERTTPWEVFVRTLPAQPWARLAGRSLSALGFAIASGGPVAAVALAAAVVLGSVPFVLLGVAIGYLTSPRSALPVANVLYLGLAYLGGVWTGPDGVPQAVAEFARALPTRAWMEILWAIAQGDAVPFADIATLVAWAIVFGSLAGWAYRRDEGQRFR
jgi:ABC-2 type transport system permease protein